MFGCFRHGELECGEKRIREIDIFDVIMDNNGGYVFRGNRFANGGNGGGMEHNAGAANTHA